MWVLLGIIAVIIIWVIAIFNSLVLKRNTLRNAWSDIEVQLKRRYDLIPNLVETVKGYAKHEKKVLEEVTNARAKALGAGGDIGTRVAAEGMLSGALKSLFAVTENYPQLRASENFQKLQDQLSTIESDIQSARRYYNAAVRELNNAIQVFPGNLIASAFNFSAEKFFDADEKEEAPVKVSF